MAKTSQEIEKEFIDGLNDTTGKDLGTWMAVIREQNIEKRNDIVKWLKEQHGFGHMHASILVGIYSNKGKPVYASEQVLLNNQFEKYPEMRSLYEQFIHKVFQWDPSVSIMIKKTYVSITKKREFAAINIKKGELRLGMDLGEMPFEGRLEKAKLIGPMLRISHMVVIKNVKEMDQAMFQLLNQANKRVNS